MPFFEEIPLVHNIAAVAANNCCIPVVSPACCRLWLDILGHKGDLVEGLDLVGKLLWVFKFVLLFDLHLQSDFNGLLDLVNQTEHVQFHQFLLLVLEQGLVVPIDFLVGSNLNRQKQLKYCFPRSVIGEFKGFSILGLGMVGEKIELAVRLVVQCAGDSFASVVLMINL